MPLSQLDKQPALIVIDLQKGIVSLPLAHPTNEITSKAAQLADSFRDRGFPVVLVNVAGGAPGRTDLSHHFDPPADWADLVPELKEHPRDHKVTKRRWGAFHGTGLDEHLKNLNVTQVFVCGIATSIGVESTARYAHEHGYHVALVTDAMTDLDPVSHQHSVEKIFPRLGETTTTNEVLSSLNTNH
ncbi:nicotinamidase-related amidase [Paraburkholderia sp. EB58]|jgi:nicotinamidase-related amidase|uniref:isochorismatase family protein n=1 Tax=Paraburkholderia sp. EB58 TaxID=3035125 RepID=UPI003D2517C9